jgi:hypothetical protein
MNIPCKVKCQPGLDILAKVLYNSGMFRGIDQQTKKATLDYLNPKDYEDSGTVQEVVARRNAEIEAHNAEVETIRAQTQEIYGELLPSLQKYPSLREK